jgi:hypothetical protein
MSAARVALTITGQVVAFIVIVFSLLALLSIVIPDPPLVRDVTPLEFVAIDADDAQCILNREDVPPGVHDFSLITEGSGATVELLDETGNAVFRGSEVIQGPTNYNVLELEEGRHRLVCRYPGGAVGEATLDVTAE